MADARAIAERTARESYGRLLAWLAAQTRDVAAAEDALSEAFRAALEHWPRTGAPSSPEAWLMTAARRKLIDQARRQNTRREARDALALISDEAFATAAEDNEFPDERLKLMFVCAHPAIDSAMHTPLILQTVLGLDAERIASAFLVQPAAMAQRLVRVKRKIRDAGIPFSIPQKEAQAERLNVVLNAIYAAYTTGWDAGDGADARDGGLTREAIFLARLVAHESPDEAEAWGLLSLALHAEARRAARLSRGAYVPIDRQDVSLWDEELIAEAEAALATAWRIGRPGRFQLEAAIQSAHAAAKIHRRDTSGDILTLYDELMKIAPSIGAAVGLAAARGNAGDAGGGLSQLEAIDPHRIERYQSYWAVRAHLLVQIGDIDKAKGAFQRAIGLAANGATRRFLQTRLKTLEQD